MDGPNIPATSTKNAEAALVAAFAFFTDRAEAIPRRGFDKIAWSDFGQPQAGPERSEG
jgi:hypothetical protein